MNIKALLAEAEDLMELTYTKSQYYKHRYDIIIESDYDSDDIYALSIVPATDRDRVHQGIHLMDPDEYALVNAIEDAVKDGFDIIWIHTEGGK